jgi:hypothetical protein
MAHQPSSLPVGIVDTISESTLMNITPSKVYSNQVSSVPSTMSCTFCRAVLGTLRPGSSDDVHRAACTDSGNKAWSPIMLVVLRLVMEGLEATRVQWWPSARFLSIVLLWAEQFYATALRLMASKQSRSFRRWFGDCRSRDSHLECVAWTRQA